MFDAWLNPEMVRRWFAPGLGELQRIEIDARVGGRFSWVDRRDREDIDHVGEYLEIDRPRRLVFTWAIAGEEDENSRVVIQFTPFDAGCELTLSHEMAPEWAGYIDQTENAWTTMLEVMSGVVNGDE